jgi:hypothetical protein
VYRIKKLKNPGSEVFSILSSFYEFLPLVLALDLDDVKPLTWLKPSGVGLISLWLYKEKTSYRMEKGSYSTNSPLSPTHTYGFVVLTSLTHPRKTLLVVV